MKRRALIIYCDNTASGELTGPPFDNELYRGFLMSNLGGRWEEGEILSLPNPKSSLVTRAINKFLDGADYTFTIFTGHGFLNTDENNRQYLEVADDDIPILSLRTTAKRQTIIIDACRGFHSPSQTILKGFSEVFESFTGDSYSTRQIFNNAVMRAEEGLTVLYAASQNQTSLDTDNGAAYLLSLLHTAEKWEEVDKKHNIIDLKETHEYAKTYLSENFETIQIPTMNREKRVKYYPFAVKGTLLNDKKPS
jgi:hypothetical protein